MRDGKKVQEDVIVISDDLKHDASAVDAFTALAHKHLQENRGLNVSKVVRFSDTCPNLYRGRNSFQFLKKATVQRMHILGLTMEKVLLMGPVQL